jgi:hypothetical protein
MSRDNLERRRSQREAARLIAQVREVLDLLERGEIDLDHGCGLIHQLGGSLGAMAARGELATV